MIGGWRSSGLLPLFLLSTILLVGVAGFNFSECSERRSCWFQPPSCTENDRASCISGIQWKVLPDGVAISMESSVNDLDPSKGHYMALGFSFNQKMDDDTVVECIREPTGKGRFQLSFNDNKNNIVLYQASSLLLTEHSHSFADGLFSCSVKILFEREAIDSTEQWMIHDLQEQPFYLLFARGVANPLSWEKEIHSTNDGALFPWTSEERVSFCGHSNCSHLAVPHLVNEMKQTDISRYWRYRIAVLHGIGLLLAWWVLGSSGILIARYFKPLFPRQKLFGTAVWFQLHRDMLIASVVIQVLCVLSIFWQAGWVWYGCSYECNNDDFALKMHAVTGVSATVLACLQPFLAFLRPSPDASNRPLFNWLHWFLGMAAWTLASATFILSLPLGKTGLNMVYDHVPNYIMGGYIITFIVTNIILEILFTTSSPSRATKIGLSGMSFSVLNGPSIEETISRPKRARCRLLVFTLHFMISLAVAISIAVLLIRHLLSHSS